MSDPKNELRLFVLQLSGQLARQAGQTGFTDKTAARVLIGISNALFDASETLLPRPNEETNE